MGRLTSKAALLLAFGVVALAFLVPVGRMIFRSFQVTEVETAKGEVYRAVGEVRSERGARAFALQGAPGEERVPMRVPEADVREVRTVLSLDHYRMVLGEARTRDLVVNSLVLGLLATLAALLLGLPVAWILARTDLRGRRLLGALCLGPAILPPFLIGMGAARPVGEALGSALGLAGTDLQVADAAVVFGFVLFPLVALLVGRALAAVPAGPFEAARLLAGPRAAFLRVVLPAVLPAVLGASILAFVIAVSDFAVPDLMGFLLPGGTTPLPVFAKEIQLQWTQEGNTGRAVATGAPFLLLTAALLAVALLLLRRSPLVRAGRGDRPRSPVALSLRGRIVAYAAVIGILALSLGLPLEGIASWAGTGGSTTATGSLPPGAVVSPKDGRLFDFAGALDRTPGSREDRDRWLKTGAAAALLAMFAAVVLARAATRGGRGIRGAVLAVGALPLAVPGLTLTVGTLLLWQDLNVAWVEQGVLRSALALTGRFLPYALLAAWLALRETRSGAEEAAATLGARPAMRAARIWGPPSLRGVLGGGLVVFLLALREIDAVMLLDTRIFPLRLYDKIHYSRLADEANLAFLYMLYLLVPAVLAALLLGRRGGGRDPSPGPGGSGSAVSA